MLPAARRRVSGVGTGCGAERPEWPSPRGQAPCRCPAGPAGQARRGREGARCPALGTADLSPVARVLETPNPPAPCPGTGPQDTRGWAVSPAGKRVKHPTPARRPGPALDPHPPWPPPASWMASVPRGRTEQKVVGCPWASEHLPHVLAHPKVPLPPILTAEDGSTSGLASSRLLPEGHRALRGSPRWPRAAGRGLRDRRRRGGGRRGEPSGGRG